MLTLEISEINLRPLRHRARYDDDPVSFPLSHMRIKQSSKGKGTKEIGGELPLETVDSQLTFWDRHHARIVDQQIDRWSRILPRKPRSELAHADLRGQIQNSRNEVRKLDLSTDAVHGAFCFRHGASRKDGFGAFACKLTGRFKANAGVCAGNQYTAARLRRNQVGGPLFRSCWHTKSILGLVSIGNKAPQWRVLTK